MKQFVAFAALLALASAGRLPHYHHRAESRIDNSYHAPAATRVNNAYLAPAATSDNAYIPPAAESRVQNAYIPPVAESRVQNEYLAPAASNVAPVQSEIVLLKEKLHENNGLDGYEYSYLLSDGQEKQESAELINQGTENEAIAVRGSFKWVDPSTGHEYKVNYVADENGFRAEGDHIPRA